MPKSKVAKKESPAAKHDKPVKAAASKGMPKAAMTILNAVANAKLNMRQDAVERKNLSFYTGIAGKSTIANALTALNRAKWLVVEPKQVIITEEGMKHANTDGFETMEVPTNEKYLDTMVKQFAKQLKPKAEDLIKFISDGRSYTKQEVATHLRMKLNSTFANLLTSVKKCGIIEYDSKTMHLTDKMFPFEPRSE